MQHQPVEPDVPNAPIPAEPDPAPPDPDEENMNTSAASTAKKLPAT